ncbi:unnamed protein product, partial [Allacma fusca]
MGNVKQQFFLARRLNYTFVAFDSESEMVQAYEISGKGLTSTKTHFGIPEITSPVLAGVVFPKLVPTTNSTETIE